jgi:hypothetical protein
MVQNYSKLNFLNRIWWWISQISGGPQPDALRRMASCRFIRIEVLWWRGTNSRDGSEFFTNISLGIAAHPANESVFWPGVDLGGGQIGRSNIFLGTYH